MTEYPTLIVVDNTIACNAACVMCPTRFAARSRQIMSDTLFEKIVSEVAGFRRNVYEFLIGCHGEPFLDKKLEARVARCTELGITQTVVTTNGSLVTEARARALLDAGAGTVIFALESLDAGVYEAIRVGLHHHEVLANILGFIQLRDSLGARTKVVIRFIESAQNAAEFQSYSEFWNARLNPELDRIEHSHLHTWAYEVLDNSEFGSGPCPYAQHTVIHSDGTVVLCCFDYSGAHAFGNVNEHSIVDIFNNEKWQEVRALHRSGQRRQIDLCKNCFAPEYWTGERRVVEKLVEFDAEAAVQRSIESPVRRP